MYKCVIIPVFAMVLHTQAAFIINDADYAETVQTNVNLDAVNDWWIHGSNAVTETFSKKIGSGITLTAQTTDAGGSMFQGGDRTHHTYLWADGSATLNNPSAPSAHDTDDYRWQNYPTGLLSGASSLDLTKGAYYTVDVASGNTRTNQVTVYGMARRNDEIYVEAVLRDSGKTITRATLSPQLLGTQSDLQSVSNISFTFSFVFHADVASDILSFTIAGYNDNAATADRSLAIDAVTVKPGVAVLPPDPSRIIHTEAVGKSLKLVIDAKSPWADLMLLRKNSLTNANWSLTTYATSSTGSFLNCDLSAAVPTTNGYRAVYVPLVNDSDFYKLDNPPQSSWFTVAKNSSGSTTTHDLVSGAMTVGISDTGGGYINRISLPGYGDIMGVQSDRYGRGGQSAIRDQLHGLVYNPTQGGFHDAAGTVCRVNTSADGRALVVAPRPCTLFRGDGYYDFTEWEDLVDDKYDSDGGNTDQDPIDESMLPGKQAAEITSEFDYYGTYENKLGLVGTSYGGTNAITIPIVRHYYEYRYVRQPDAIKQFSQGSSKYSPTTGDVTDISVVNPSGTHADTQYDLGVLIDEISIRIDRAIWTPTHIGLVDGSTIGDLTMQLRPTTDGGNNGLTLREFHYDSVLHARAPNAPRGTPTPIAVPLFILAESANIDAPGALGLYYPDSATNEFSIIGVNRSSGAIVYQDDRRMQMDLRDVALRTDTMSWCGFRGTVLGLLNPTRLPATQYEALRGEYYLLYGSPREIFENAQRIHSF